MRNVFSWILGGAFLVIGASGAEAQDKAKIEHGQKVYAAQKCRVCHSIGGEGQKKGPLDGVGSKLSEQELRDWLMKPAEMHKKTKSTRKPFMKDYSTLPKEDLDALVAYMQSLKKS
jgi:mono/diheme cytochrome c family protein